MSAVAQQQPVVEYPHKLSDLIDLAFDRREVIREKQKEVDTLKAQFTELEQEIIRRLEEEGVGARATKATATITKDIYPSIKDRDAFNAYLLETGQLYLYEARPSVTGCRELHLAGEVLPGIEFFEKKGLSLRKVSAR